MANGFHFMHPSKIGESLNNRYTTERWGAIRHRIKARGLSFPTGGAVWSCSTQPDLPSLRILRAVLGTAFLPPLSASMRVSGPLPQGKAF